MSDYTQFNASTPEVVEATAEVTYDKYWLSSFRINASNPTGKVRARATFVPARDVTIQVEGEDVVVKELKPNGGGKELVIEDLFGEAETDADLKAALEAVLAVLNTRASNEGVI